MTRRTDFKKAITYTGQRLDGVIEITYKIDGVRVLYRDGKFVTRNDKEQLGFYKCVTAGAQVKIKLYKDVELFVGSFHATNGPLTQKEPTPGLIKASDVYPLDIGGKVDSRLYGGTVENPTSECIHQHLLIALSKGYEGLVLRSTNHWYRVKPDDTADVRVTGWFEQHDKDKNPKGQLGGFTTDYGRVTAFTEAMRQELWDNPEQYVGRLMEVRYKELYPSGSFRYAVTFLRFRDDKDEESFDKRCESE